MKGKEKINDTTLHLIVFYWVVKNLEDDYGLTMSLNRLSFTFSFNPCENFLPLNAFENAFKTRLKR